MAECEREKKKSHMRKRGKGSDLTLDEETREGSALKHTPHEPEQKLVYSSSEWDTFLTLSGMVLQPQGLAKGLSHKLRKSCLCLLSCLTTLLLSSSVKQGNELDGSCGTA